ncbi:MAG: sulfatase-like hydrolase/transferase [Isosphaeraceae bacterium]
MVRRPAVLYLLLLVGFLTPATTCGRARGAEDRPRLILILADDLGWGDVGFNGRTEWATPQLDLLAARGAILRRCYAASPVCGPSRAAILTGKGTIHNGVRRNDQDLPAEETTIAEVLKPLGYRSAVFGKWQRGRARAGRPEGVHPLDQGFDEFFGYTDPYSALEKNPVRAWQGREQVATSGYIDDLITDRAVDFVSRHRDRPFFLYLSYLAPHHTIDAPADEVERHRGKLPEARPERPVNARYAAMITRMDRNIGRLTETLRRLDLERSTFILFASDNGATFEFANQGASAALDSNRPFRGQKRTLWEGGIRVPALACWPGRIKPGQVLAANVQLIDVLPTFLAAAGGTADPGWHLDGADLLPLLTGRSALPARTLFWEWRGEGSDQVAALDRDLKLIVTSGGKPELYDIAADNAERRDLGGSEPDRSEQLKLDLDRWLTTADPRGND